MSVELDADFVVALINSKMQELQDATPQKHEQILAQIAEILSHADNNKMTLDDIAKAVARLNNPFKLVF